MEDKDELTTAAAEKEVVTRKEIAVEEGKNTKLSQAEEEEELDSSLEVEVELELDSSLEVEEELDSSLEVADQSVTLDSLLEADDEADYEESEPESAELTEEEWFAAVAEDAEEGEDKLPLTLLDTLLANVLGEEEEEEEEGSEAEEKDVEPQAPSDEKMVEVNG